MGRQSRHRRVDESSLGKTFNRLKEWFRMIGENFGKFVPVAGLVMLFAIYATGRDMSEQGSAIPAKERIFEALRGLQESFLFDNVLYAITTLILLVTIWTGYKYWLCNIRVIRRNGNLLEKLVIAIMLIVFLTRHVRAESVLGEYVDWTIFLVLLYLVIVGSWFLAKTIDAIDLHSDLYCWGLRLLGGLCMFFGIMLLLSSSLTLALNASSLVIENIFWVASISIILLGAFMEYRSFRRHPAIMVW